VTVEKDTSQDVSPANIEQMFYDQNEKCYYSGEQLTFDNISLEHKIPLSRGGLHVMDNVVWATKQINRMKGTMNDAEFIEVCEQIACYAAQKKRGSLPRV
jgi:CRISPR/Cas system Type II protein with McrA/HNH and RuvC-like nuclease domain